MKAVGKSLFAAPPADTTAALHVAYERVSAAELGLRESWFRDAIFRDPELVLGPCREAGRISTDEKWLPWKKEYNFGAGPVDVLLVSSRGRPAIVETKLSYNPEKRREVVAQILDYALSLEETLVEDLPALPDSELAPEIADLEDSLSTGNLLLVIAGDALDPRALRLSQALLAGHLTSEWDLAMVDLNLYRSTRGQDQLLIVPELRGVLIAETRQVVRVQVEGETPRARIQVERLPSEDFSSARRPRFGSIEDFLARVHDLAPEREAAVVRVADRFKQVEATTEGCFSLGLQTASANLYWKSPSGSLRRIFALVQEGRFRVWAAYVESEGRKDVADTIRELSKPVVTILPTDGSGTVFLDQRNVDAVLSVIDSVVSALVYDQA